MTAPNWSLQARKLKDLKPHPSNPRRLTTDQAAHLTVSMEKFGLSEKPIINQDNMIIGGHQRVKLLKKLKYKEVDCWVPDRPLDEEEVNELLIRLNQNHGEFNFDDLANNFEPLKLLEWGFSENDLLGFATDEEDKSKKDKSKKLHTCPKCGEEFT